MRFLALACLSWMLCSATAFGCSCANTGPRSCNILSDRNASIFVGTVVSVDNPPKEGDREGGTAHYHFRTAEWLSPDNRAEVEVLSGRGGADCSIWFKTGVPYLVFAYRGENGELWATVCSNTQSLANAGPLLMQLRAMHNGTPVARVYGTLWQVQQPYSATFQPDFNKPLPQVKLRLESPKHKAVTTTASDGTFAVYDLPSGTYKINADLPADLELAQTILSDPVPPLKLDDGSCVNLDIEVLPKGRIRGRLIGDDNKTLWNSSVELFSADKFDETTAGWWESAGEDKKYFEFKHVAPGDYILVFNRSNRLDTDVPYPRAFFPDAPDLARAERIHVGPGDQLLNTDIHLSGRKATRTIRIRVVFAGGGEPTSSLVFANGSQGESVFATPLEENLYELQVLPDSEYTFTARTNFCEPSTQSQPIKLRGDTAPPRLTIAVPETKCTPLPEGLKDRFRK
jgi:hypothetical protein